MPLIIRVNGLLGTYLECRLSAIDHSQAVPVMAQNLAARARRIAVLIPSYSFSSVVGRTVTQPSGDLAQERDEPASAFRRDGRPYLRECEGS